MRLTYILITCLSLILSTNGKTVPQWNDILTRAESGDSNFQYQIAVCYDVGCPIEKDDSLAFRWYTKAAKSGHAEAQFKLGVYYAHGINIKKNAKEAVNWYTKSAKQGNSQAQYNLASCYLRGAGVEQNLSEAFKWLQLAAQEEGFTDALFNLAYYYERGIGTIIELEKSLCLYKKCALIGDKVARDKVEQLESRIAMQREHGKNSVGSPSNELHLYYLDFLSQYYEASADLLENDQLNDIYPILRQIEIQSGLDVSKLSPEHQSYMQNFRLIAVDLFKHQQAMQDKKQLKKIISKTLERIDLINSEYPTVSFELSLNKAEEYLSHLINMKVVMTEIAEKLTADSTYSATESKFTSEILRQFGDTIRKLPTPH